MFFLSFVNRFNPSPLFSEHTSLQQHIPGRSPESLNWDFWKKVGGRSQPCFNYNPLLQHITAIGSAWIVLLSPPAQATAVVPCLSADETRCSWTPQPGSPEVQQNPVTSAASSLPGSSGLPRATNPEEQNEDESRWERGKGSVCVFIFIFILFFYQAQLFGKKRRRTMLWAGILPSFLPCLASPSTPPSVQRV